jgi:hypothetical protein
MFTLVINNVNISSIDDEYCQCLLLGTIRLASCRNMLLRKARSEMLSFDYYFVIDVDVGSSSSFNIDDFRSNFLYGPSSWIAMTATQRSEYYDIWALRIAPFLLFDCWQRISQLTPISIGQSILIERLIRIHQVPIPRHLPLIRVQSAFGGAAVYAAKYLHEQCIYDGGDSSSWFLTSEQCEHVSFHQCLTATNIGKNIYINPKFQIT